ncbi:MAG TPA: CBS domain-containing protein [Planctomycetota bacterium]
MNVKVHELMTRSVFTTERHKSIQHVRELMESHRIGAIPVVDGEGRPIGIVSSTDLVPESKSGAPVSTIMSENVYSVPEYDDASVAARIMRNHRIHHLVVTHEQKVVGFLSSFDLLALVENHRFVAKNPPTAPGRPPKRT